MTFDQLRYFYEAARFQHIGKASKAVHISPSAVSSAIAALEEELKVLLFDRVGKTIVLTEAGKKLQKEAEAVFDQLDGIKFRVGEKVDELNGSYRLGASHFLAMKVMTGAWTKLQKDHPSLVGEICSLSTRTVISEVISGALDLGLCFSPFPHPDLIQEELYQGELVVAVKANHPMKSLETAKASNELSQYPAVIHKAQPGVDVCENHPIFEEFGIEPKISFLYDNDACAVEKILHSDAWALVPDVVVKSYGKKIRALKVPSNWSAPYKISVITRRDRSKNVVLSKMKELLSNVTTFS